MIQIFNLWLQFKVTLDKRPQQRPDRNKESLVLKRPRYKVREDSNNFRLQTKLFLPLDLEPSSSSHN